ncbi:MAG: methionine--tRNA ligase [Candidatus Spechtbacterales bacterium]
MPNKTFYITTAIDYVNGRPHIGHALEKVQADAVARYQRLHNKEVFFATGTDEHGVKNARAAEAAGKTPHEYTAENSEVFKELTKALNISQDVFVRTSDQERHWPGVQKLWKILEKNGDLYKKEYTGLYCVGHEAFVTQKDLKDGICEIHGATPEEIAEENYFFRLSKYTDGIKKAITSGELKIVPKEREHEILSLLDMGLEDVSFSRPSKDLSWGVPVPGDKDHTMYVWADALPNYLTALGYGTTHDANVKKFWPADVHVIGKDILRFHAAIWPGMLLSAGLPLPKALLVHGFVSVEGKKMSKSLGNVVDPFELVEKYGADAVRYYVLAEIPATKDGDFSIEKFEARYNGDLALGLGNLVARVTTLGDTHITKRLPLEPSKETKAVIKQHEAAYEENMEAFKFNEAITDINTLIKYADKRISDVKLWELPKKDNEKFIAEITDVAAMLARLVHMLGPIIPDTAARIADRLGIEGEGGRLTFKLKKAEGLFPRLG